MNILFCWINLFGATTYHIVNTPYSIYLLRRMASFLAETKLRWVKLVVFYNFSVYFTCDATELDLDFYSFLLSVLNCSCSRSSGLKP